MIITGSKITESFSNLPELNGNAIVIGKGIILDIGPLHKIRQKFSNHRVLRFDQILIMPGLVNSHTHLELPPLLSTDRITSLPEWVLQLLKEKKKLAAADYSAAVRENLKTLIRSGTTSVAEICSHGTSPHFIKQAGMRGLIFQEIISMNPSFPAPRFANLLSSPSFLIQSGLSPHAPHTVSIKTLCEIAEFASRKRLALCMHVAESKDEIKLLQGKKSGFEKLYAKAGWDLSWAPKAESPFDYLCNLGLLGPRFLAVHAVQATDHDIALLRKTRTPIAHCPRSNKELGVGRMPLKKFLNAGITVGLGTDSLASSPSLNMWDEMRYALKVHKKDGITARDIFELATLGGAKALGLDKEIGSIEIGKKADLIAVPLPSKNTGDIYSDLLRETNSCIMSMVNGKIIWKDQEMHE